MPKRGTTYTSRFMSLKMRKIMWAGKINIQIVEVGEVVILFQ